MNPLQLRHISFKCMHQYSNELRETIVNTEECLEPLRIDNQSFEVNYND